MLFAGAGLITSLVLFLWNCLAPVETRFLWSVVALPFALGWLLCIIQVTYEASRRR